MRWSVRSWDGHVRGRTPGGRSAPTAAAVSLRLAGLEEPLAAGAHWLAGYIGLGELRLKLPDAFPAEETRLWPLRA